MFRWDLADFGYAFGLGVGLPIWDQIPGPNTEDNAL
jgi:hypothetical protein